MHKRPKLQEAINVLKKLSDQNEDCASALSEYNQMIDNGDEFFAARMIVDIVDHYYHILDTKGIVHG
jgi:hypothetical protein|tara:strand:- start:204 stop:404 length:201 start_codon:yes stop_codon:yes gene_type:complete